MNISRYLKKFLIFFKTDVYFWVIQYSNFIRIIKLIFKSFLILYTILNFPFPYNIYLIAVFILRNNYTYLLILFCWEF